MDGQHQLLPQSQVLSDRPDVKLELACRNEVSVFNQFSLRLSIALDQLSARSVLAASNPTLTQQLESTPSAKFRGFRVRERR